MLFGKFIAACFLAAQEVKLGESRNALMIIREAR